MGLRPDASCEEGGFGGSGDVAVVKSRVGISSELSTGLPQAEQKRTLSPKALPQEEQ